MNNPTNFSALDLSPEMLRALEALNFHTPSPIQTQAIGPMMEGVDLIGQAQTGTGKTAAFAIPIIEKLDPKSRNIQALVLCPTRELAIQVADSFRKLLQFKPNTQVLSVYGGQPIDKQLKALKKRPQIIVGTPGRTLDHIRRYSIRLNDIKTVVLDEADEMLDMGFREDLEQILKQTPAERQTVLFSATMPKAILELTTRYQSTPLHLNVLPEETETERIAEQMVEVTRSAKFNVLTGLITNHAFQRALVFCNTQRQVDNLAVQLQQEGYGAEGLHGGMSQNKRDRVMSKFRAGKLRLLVATDVAARGIDVQHVEAVFNYEIPEDRERYIHRIGRTGRAGSTGQAFTFIDSQQTQKRKTFEKVLNTKLETPASEGVDKHGSTPATRKKRPFFGKKKRRFPQTKKAAGS